MSARALPPDVLRCERGRPAGGGDAVMAVASPAPAIAGAALAAGTAPAALTLRRIRDRRQISAPARMSPLTNRSTAAAAGLANSVRKVCSRATPVRPTGIV